MATGPEKEVQLSDESCYVYEEEQKAKKKTIPPEPDKVKRVLTVDRQDSNLYDLPDVVEKDSEEDEEFDSVSEKSGGDAKHTKQINSASLLTCPPKAETVIACTILALVFGGLGMAIGYYGLGQGNSYFQLIFRDLKSL